jgi:hypothetical protein
MLNTKLRQIEIWVVEYKHKTYSETLEYKIRAKNPNQAMKNAEPIFKAETKSYTKKEQAGFYISSVCLEGYVYA